MDKSAVQIESPNVAVERRFKIVTCEKTGIKATFDRLRAQLAQEAEQKVVLRHGCTLVSGLSKPNLS